ncbi:WD40-repeat-containing domain protein [Lanmaoa asiatica]|nr:WD40-repeat-containing domain protein [Lanmaoa asiatica]
MTECSPLIEIDSGDLLCAVTFTANGEYLVGGDKKKVRVWQVNDGKQMAAMAAKGINCLAVSKDGRWIAAGTAWGDVIVWDAKSYEKAFTLKNGGVINGVDFSPDSTRLVVASESVLTATAVWDITTRERVVGLGLESSGVRTAKYSPQGDQIAKATDESIRVNDSNDGRLLVDINVKATPRYNSGLVWSNDQLFVISESKIKQIEASTGSAVSEWPVPDSNDFSCIALPQHGEFIACSTNHTVTLWDTTTHTQLGLIQHTEDIRSIALSPNDPLLAIVGKDGKITIKSLSRIADSIPLSRLHPTFQEPEIHINDAVLHSWTHDQFANAETLLTQEIADSRYANHHILASRALVRARLQHWDAAIDDAKQVFATLLSHTLTLMPMYIKSVNIQPSIIGYIAMGVALVGKGKRHEAYRACDIAFEHFHSTHVSFLLLIKAIIVYMAGEHDDAISRLDDLITTQAYMYLLLGNLRMESDYQGAIQLFERARAQTRHHGCRSLLVISLISGWKFDDLAITTRQRLCEALYAAGFMRDASENLLDMVNTFDEEVYASKPITNWVSDIKQRCAEKLVHSGDAAADARRHDDAITHYSAALSLSPAVPQDIFIKRSKVNVARELWKDALDDTNQVMALDPLSAWGHESVLMEWAKVNLTDMSWKNALATAGRVSVSIH